MDKLKHGLQDTAAELVDQLSSVRTQKSRAGDALERVFNLIKGNVPPAAIAITMTHNTKVAFSEQDAQAYHKLYQASQQQVALSKKQTVALLRNQTKTHSTEAFPVELEPVGLEG